MQFSISNKAKEDLVNIASYKKQGRDRALIKQFDDTFHLLADIPLAGTPCDEIKPGYLKYPQGKHVIFYTKAEDTNISVIRILHTSIDIPSPV